MSLLVANWKDGQAEIRNETKGIIGYEPSGIIKTIAPFINAFGCCFVTRQYAIQLSDLLVRVGGLFLGRVFYFHTAMHQWTIIVRSAPRNVEFHVALLGRRYGMVCELYMGIY